MAMITVDKDSLGQPVKLYCEDVGHGPPVVFVHGWPFEHGMWESQRRALVDGGCRVITYDQRGFGASSKPLHGYHYNQLTDDLRVLLDTLDLQDVILAGFSMGAAEVVYYMSRNFGQRVRQVALISSVTPRLPANDFVEMALPGMRELAAGGHPEPEVLAEPIARRMFAGAPSTLSRGMAIEWAARLAASPASAMALSDTALAMQETDLTSAMQSIEHVPTLLIHGARDQVAPFEANAVRTSHMLPDCHFKPYEDAPHGLFATHAERLNEDLLKFIHEPPAYVLPRAMP
jgi:pimeloyl-ACP methyl ester carboxylesterase